MKILYSILFVMFLSGCQPSPMEKALQDYACKAYGGVYNYSTSRRDHLICNDNKTFIQSDWNKIQLTEEYYPEVKDEN